MTAGSSKSWIMMTRKETMMNDMAKKKNEPKKKTMTGSMKAIIAIIVVSAILITATIGGSIFYVVSSANKPVEQSQLKETNDSKTKAGNMPDNPSKSAMTWLGTLFDDTSKKFPAETFSEGNETLQKIMNGDTSVVPDEIKNRVSMGTNTTGMMIGREILDSASYTGLMMFANAYEKTKERGVELSGERLISYSADENTVYIPIQAMVSSDQNIVFILKWNGSDWKLQGDVLGWQTYVMLQNQASAAQNSNSDSK